MIKFVAYLPGKAKAVPVELLRASESADLAVLHREDEQRAIPSLRLADAPPTAGVEVIVMGYPTGLRSMLAQSGEAFIGELQKTENTGFWSVAARLAEKGYIAPLASRGIVGQATAAAIVYDAETTHGGSGGPVLDMNGDVIAVNAAILPEYGGSNLGVPAAKVRELLDEVSRSKSTPLAGEAPLDAIQPSVGGCPGSIGGTRAASCSACVTRSPWEVRHGSLGCQVFGGFRRWPG